jgi:hypothetical protein
MDLPEVCCSLYYGDGCPPCTHFRKVTFNKYFLPYNGKEVTGTDGKKYKLVCNEYEAQSYRENQDCYNYCSVNDISFDTVPTIYLKRCRGDWMQYSGNRTYTDIFGAMGLTIPIYPYTQFGGDPYYSKYKKYKGKYQALKNRQK